MLGSLTITLHGSSCINQQSWLDLCVFSRNLANPNDAITPPGLDELRKSYQYSHVNTRDTPFHICLPLKSTR